MPNQYTLFLSYNDQKLYLAPRHSISVQEATDFETFADEVSCGCVVPTSRTFKFTVWFGNGCSLASAWALYNQLVAFLADSCDSDLLLSRRVFDEPALVFKVTKSSLRMIDTQSQFFSPRSLKMEFIVTLKDWATVGTGQVLVGSVARATFAPLMVVVSAPVPDTTRLLSILATPLVVGVTIPATVPALAVAVSPLVVTVTPTAPFIAPSLLPLAVTVSMPTPSLGGVPGSYFELVDAEASLVGYYRLVETAGTTATDSSSTANNGTYSGGPTLGQTGPFIYYTTSKSVRLVTGSLVSIPNVAGQNLGDVFTLEFIVKKISIVSKVYLYRFSAYSSKCKCRISSSKYVILARTSKWVVCLSTDYYAINYNLSQYSSYF